MLALHICLSMFTMQGFELWLCGQVTGVRPAMTEPGQGAGVLLGPGRGKCTTKSQWQMRGCAGWVGPPAKPAWTWAMILSVLVSEAQVHSMAVHDCTLSIMQWFWHPCYDAFKCAYVLGRLRSCL